MPSPWSYAPTKYVAAKIPRQARSPPRPNPPPGGTRLRQIAHPALSRQRAAAVTACRCRKTIRDQGPAVLPERQVPWDGAAELRDPVVRRGPPDGSLSFSSSSGGRQGVVRDQVGGPNATAIWSISTKQGLALACISPEPATSGYGFAARSHGRSSPGMAPVNGQVQTHQAPRSGVFDSSRKATADFVIDGAFRFPG
jgi:hypothetical protein